MGPLYFCITGAATDIFGSLNPSMERRHEREPKSPESSRELVLRDLLSNILNSSYVTVDSTAIYLENSPPVETNVVKGDYAISLGELSLPHVNQHYSQAPVILTVDNFQGAIRLRSAEKMRAVPELEAAINAHLSTHHLLALAKAHFKGHIDLTQQRLARLEEELLQMTANSHELKDALRVKKGYEEEIESARTLLHRLSPSAQIHFNFEEHKAPRLVLRIEMPKMGDDARD